MGQMRIDGGEDTAADKAIETANNKPGLVDVKVTVLITTTFGKRVIEEAVDKVPSQAVLELVKCLTSGDRFKDSVVGNCGKQGAF